MAHGSLIFVSFHSRFNNPIVAALRKGWRKGSGDKRAKGVKKRSAMFCPTQRRTSRGRPIVCPGLCNHRNRGPGMGHLRAKVNDDGCVVLKAPSSPWRKAAARNEKALGKPCASREMFDAEEPAQESRNKVKSPVAKCRKVRIPHPDDTRQGCSAESPATFDLQGAKEKMGKTLRILAANAPAGWTERLSVNVLNFPRLLTSILDDFRDLVTDVTPMTKCLAAGAILVGGQIILALIAWNHPIYQGFLAAEFCGFLTFVVWSLMASMSL